MEYSVCMMTRYFAIFIFISQACALESHSPLVFTSWPPTKSQTPSFRQQIMMALRPIMRQPSTDFLYKRTPPLLPQPQRLVRPMKLSGNSPYFLLKNHFTTSYKRPTLTPLTSINNLKSSPSASPGEYVFENPFTNSLLQTQSITPSPTANAERFNPIHTIPAPNLSQLEVFPEWKSKPVNEYYEKPHPVFLPQRPNDIHQYQVTEETNDHTINDLASGTRKLYAPDPDPSLPAFKVKPATDPFSQPSNSNVQSFNLFGTLPSSSALIQSPPASIQFGSSNSQLLQNFVQQQSIAQGMPQPVYNPTYLVTQSNQLLDQHKRHLFQPEVVEEKSNLLAEASNLTPVKSVASPGQIMAAAKDKISDITSYEVLPSNPSPLIGDKFLSNSDAPTLTEKEVSDLINFGKLYDNLEHSGFIASTYYDSFPDGQGDFDITPQQRDNEEILRRANEDIAAKKASVTIRPTIANIVTEQSQISSKEFESLPLRIIVPDNPDTDVQIRAITNEVKRSDDFPIESNTESDIFSNVDEQVTHTETNSVYNLMNASTDDKTEITGSFEFYVDDSTEDMEHST
ncbi:hypothetical protein Bhyg_10080 [Pseudolycoriella hygida]|uniref:Uncharacterized protein n=1 Tax=Pseudolycoriella hygida TaxID=35572 RepID=A0A9Q0RX23_9DIPT|nr:hypothetical protein Bhyg_10080 [Pseudolycoriella hygida]